ncbi:DUF6132 family protein [Leptonema illini]|jgi:hypothetical protein|uniref:Uncharacterized protein n=1 Tax=Leptonema illini DSM 21528 TaxID=929563 RepID=H2CLI0_9LEPT|nr:DUF6132 family protein [Leptonema illini]EHQ04591.1 hypothetical protein Lepil_4113 [Leptonema illini DSM 21528]
MEVLLESLFSPALLRWLVLPAGALVGYLYYRLIGCKSGACPLTSSPWSSSLIGLALAYLFFFK